MHPGEFMAFFLKHPSLDIVGSRMLNWMDHWSVLVCRFPFGIYRTLQMLKSNGISSDKGRWKRNVCSRVEESKPILPGECVLTLLVILSIYT